MTKVMGMTKEARKLKAPKLFTDELIDQLLAPVQHKDAASTSAEPG